MAKTTAKAKAHLATTPAEGDIRDRLKTYLDTIEESWFYFSRDAAEVYDNELFKSWGHERFKDYVAAELPAVSERVALWRVQIGQAIKKFDLTASQCSGMGWSNFKEIASLMLRDNATEKQVGEWIEYAQNHTFKEVAEYVKKKKVSRGGEEKEAVTISHRYNDEQAKVIEKAEELALSMLELDAAKPNARNRASEFIHLHFLQYNDPKQTEGLKSKLSEVPVAAEKTPRKQYAQKGKAKAAPKAKAEKKVAPKATKKAPAKAAKAPSTASKATKKATPAKKAKNSDPLA